MGLMLQSYKVTLLQSDNMCPPCPKPAKSNLHGAKNYRFETSKLRFFQIRQIHAENRLKSAGKIWKYWIIFVPLQSIREMLCECGLRLSIARASSALHSPCTTLALSGQKRESATRCSWPSRSLIPCKNTHLWQRFCMK